MQRSRIGRRVLMGCAVLVGAVLWTTNVTGTEAVTGVLTVDRTGSGPGALLGRDIKIDVITARGTKRKLKVSGQDASGSLKLQPGWVQVNCRPSVGTGARGHSVEILAQRVTKVSCFFQPKVAPVINLVVTQPVDEDSLNIFAELKEQAEVAPGSIGTGGNAMSASRVMRKDKIAPSSKSHRRSRRVGFSSGGMASPPLLDREGYGVASENRFREVGVSPTSTFSIDVDTASYANTRRYLEQMKRLPPSGAVRVEELINYFEYDYSAPSSGEPFSTHTEVSVAPWNPARRLIHIGLQGKKVSQEERPPSNLVFLIDVSGSMSSANKLPLLKKAFAMLVNQLDSRDRVSIVVYASRQGLIASGTPGDRRNEILGALNRLSAGGSTAGGAGITLAYKEARKHFIEGGSNRVILATDGDFNVGVSSAGGLVNLIKKERESGVFLSVLGFGHGNYQDDRMEQLSNHGNGVAAYIDSLAEAKKVLVDQAGGALVTIAKDVKIQVEFNPAKVAQYRLVGYANRQLKHEDFKDDKKDAGDMGAGHTVTVLYEIVPRDNNGVDGSKSELRYQSSTATAGHANELMTLKVRYKEPAGHASKLQQRVLVDHNTPLAQTSDSFRFAAAVAQFGMLLGGSKHAGTASFSDLTAQAKGALGSDTKGYRKGFVALAKLATQLAQKSGVPD
jgi:Ca-activated chloride channel homolog